MGSSLDARGKPTFDNEADPQTDLQTAADWADKVGAGIRGTSAERALIAPGEIDDGQMFVETDTGSIYLRLSSGWRHIFSPLTSYTPTLTNFSLGTGGVAVGRYLVASGTVEYWVDLTFGSSPSTSGAFYVSLPLTASTAVSMTGSFYATGPSSGRYVGAVGLDNSTRVWLLRSDNAFIANSTWAWASGHRISIHGGYILP